MAWNFEMISLTVQELSWWQTDRVTNRHNWKQYHPPAQVVKTANINEKKYVWTYESITYIFSMNKLHEDIFWDDGVCWVRTRRITIGSTEFLPCLTIVHRQAHVQHSYTTKFFYYEHMLYNISTRNVCCGKCPIAAQPLLGMGKFYIFGVTRHHNIKPQRFRSHSLQFWCHLISSVTWTFHGQLQYCIWFAIPVCGTLKPSLSHGCSDIVVSKI